LKRKIEYSFKCEDKVMLSLLEPTPLDKEHFAASDGEFRIVVFNGTEQVPYLVRDEEDREEAIKFAKEANANGSEGKHSDLYFVYNDQGEQVYPIAEEEDDELSHMVDLLDNTAFGV
jgi:hypothetical protein